MKTLLISLFVLTIVAVMAFGANQMTAVAGPVPVCSHICNCAAPSGLICECVWDCGGYMAFTYPTCIEWCARGCGESPC
jgi:hypothetical protein